MKKRSKQTSANYVDNEKFYQTIVVYKSKCRDAANVGDIKPRIPEFCGECILKIAENFSNDFKFVNYSFKDQMVSDGYEDCIKYFDNFDETKYKNPFAYFTQICRWAFVNRIKVEEKVRYATYKHFDETMILTGQADLMVDETNSLIVEPIYDNLSEFISDFERKEAKKKAKKRERLQQRKLDDLLEDDDE